ASAALGLRTLVLIRTRSTARATRSCSSLVAQYGIKQPPAFTEVIEHGLQAPHVLLRQPRWRGALRLALANIIAGLLLRGAFCGPFLQPALRARAGRLRCPRLPDVLHEPLALLFQDALDAADGVALGIEQVPNAAQQVHVLRTIIAPATAALHWSDLVETAFPEPQHVLRNLKLSRAFADRAERLWCLVQPPALPGASRWCARSPQAH